MQNEGNTSNPSAAGSGIGQQQGLGAEHSGGSGSTSRVRGMASEATEKIMDTAERQKRAGADYVTGVAESVRRAAGEFDEQLPQAARYIRRAADQIDTMSDSLRRREMRQMLSDVQTFARRQPAAFLGVSLLAGFAAMRFLKSSAPSPSPDYRSSRRGERMTDESFDDGRYGTPAASMPSARAREPGSMPSGHGM